MSGNSAADEVSASDVFSDESGRNAVDRDKSEVSVSVGDMFCDDCGGRRVFHDYFDTWECQECGAREEVDDESPTFDSVIGQETTQDKWNSVDQDTEDDWEPLDGSSSKECPECGETNISSYQQQTGGADEGMTGFHECKECGHNWRTGYGS